MRRQTLAAEKLVEQIEVSALTRRAFRIVLRDIGKMIRPRERRDMDLRANVVVGLEHLLRGSLGVNLRKNHAAGQSP